MPSCKTGLYFRFWDQRVIDLVGDGARALVFERDDLWKASTDDDVTDEKPVEVTTLNIRAPLLYAGEDDVQREAFEAVKNAVMDKISEDSDWTVSRAAIDTTSSLVASYVVAPEITITGQPGSVEDIRMIAIDAALRSFGLPTEPEPDPDVITSKSEIDGVVVQGNVHVYSRDEEIHDVCSINLRTGELSISLRRVIAGKLLTVSKSPDDLRVIMNHPLRGEIQLYPREAVSTPSP